ncbi:conserved hypothetical protein [Candidatus Sulfopaludibacter sp. SbA4]|nr:conserved hypothetical protein [Candidatus Sulfopaludibacter sp. SbA4]
MGQALSPANLYFGVILIIVITCVIAIAVIAFILGVRPKDLPVPEPESPFQHLDERKAAIYENLRDLQFEYRVGKLSDEDYQSTKKDLQKELAGVLAEVDKIKLTLNGASRPAAPSAPATASATAPAAATPSRNNRSRDRDSPLASEGAVPPPTPFSCAACGATFDKPLKFCGECGKPMKVTQ